MASTPSQQLENLLKEILASREPHEYPSQNKIIDKWSIESMKESIEMRVSKLSDAEQRVFLRELYLRLGKLYQDFSDALKIWEDNYHF